MGKFQPGQSGNLKGRPRKTRALAAIIEMVGNIKHDNVANKRLLAESLWEVVRTKRYNGEAVTLTQWMEIIQWLGQHIDGPVPQNIGVEQSGEVVMRIVYENARPDGSAETTS